MTPAGGNRTGVRVNYGEHDSHVQLQYRRKVWDKQHLIAYPWHPIYAVVQRFLCGFFKLTPVNFFTVFVFDDR